MVERPEGPQLEVLEVLEVPVRQQIVILMGGGGGTRGLQLSQCVLTTVPQASAVVAQRLY